MSVRHVGCVAGAVARFIARFRQAPRNCHYVDGGRRMTSWSGASRRPHAMRPKPILVTSFQITLLRISAVDSKAAHGEERRPFSCLGENEPPPPTFLLWRTPLS